VPPASSPRPLVVLHAFPLDATAWEPFLEALAWPGPVIAPDFPGFGGAAPEPAPTIVRFADAVANLVRPARGALVVGLSMGGYAALALAVRHPGLVGALVLACTRADGDDETSRAGRARNIETVRAEGRDAFVDGTIPRLVAPGAAPETVARLRAIAGRQPPEAIVAALGALRDRPDRSGELAAIAAPSLVIAGVQDAVIPPAATRALAAGLRRGRLAIVEGAGHLAPLERPATAASLVRGLAAALPDL
jgi:pimeloyl-ACP methyl ester carboxylesterase